jgi:hypothetical protein
MIFATSDLGLDVESKSLQFEPGLFRPRLGAREYRRK